MRTLCVSALTVICYSVCLAGTKTDDIDVSAAQKAYRKGDVITGTVARPSKKDAGTTYVLSAGVGDEDFTIVTDSETGVNTFGFALETTGLDAGVLTLIPTRPMWPLTKASHIALTLGFESNNLSLLSIHFTLFSTRFDHCQVGLGNFHLLLNLSYCGLKAIATVQNRNYLP